MKIRTAQSNFIVVALVTAFVTLATSPLRGRDSSKTKLPTVQQVLDRSVNALGGREAIFKHKSMTIRGKVLVGDKGPVMDRTVYYMDRKMLYKMTLPGGGLYQEGFDGRVAWQLSPGPVILEGKEAKAKERDADMYYPARTLDYYSSMNVVDVADFEGHTCYHLKGTTKWDIPYEQFYDTTTGLLVGYKFNTEWRGGPGDESEVFSDYKGFDGWLMPTTDTGNSNEGTQTQAIASVTFDDVADSVFTLPHAVKELLAKKGGH